jgi:CDP-2,3-bis-(O-geranylgeranyl)-sn-glycerol synthase
MNWEIIIQSFWIILPAYIANASAKLSGGGIPIDFYKKYKDGKRILGNGKTWNGLIIGGLIGVIAGFALATIAPMLNQIFIENDIETLSLTNFEGFPFMIPIIASITYGALIGDIIESFFKRRRDINRGQDWIPFDQLDFIIGVLLFSFLISGFLNITSLTSKNWFFENITIWHSLFLILVTPFFHIISNFLHKKMDKKIKNEK